MLKVVIEGSKDEVSQFLETTKQEEKDKPTPLSSVMKSAYLETLEKRVVEEAKKRHRSMTSFYATVLGYNGGNKYKEKINQIVKDKNLKIEVETERAGKLQKQEEVEAQKEKMRALAKSKWVSVGEIEETLLSTKPCKTTKKAIVDYFESLIAQGKAEKADAGNRTLYHVK